MTNIIIRYYERAEQAQAVLFELVQNRRVSPRIIDIFETSDGLVDRLTRQGVRPATADAYATKMASGGAVLLVRAGFKPLAVAKTTRTVADQMGAVDMGRLTEEVVAADDRKRGLSVMTDHNHIMTLAHGLKRQNHHMRLGLLGCSAGEGHKRARRSSEICAMRIGIPGHKYMANQVMPQSTS